MTRINDQREAVEQLFRADKNTFIDVAALNFVRFEDVDGNAIAHLKFKDGTSETIQGEAVINLGKHLTRFDNAQQNAPARSVEEEQVHVARSVEQKQGEVEGNHAAVPQQGGIHLETVEVPFDFHFNPYEGNKKAWYYRKDENGRRLIFAFVNAKGSCSVRPFDADHNVAFKKQYGHGPYQEHFADLIKGATPLTVAAQPNLELHCKERLPKDLFEYLRKQIEQIERNEGKGN
jgi:hypothetical protein